MDSGLPAVSDISSRLLENATSEKVRVFLNLLMQLDSSYLKNSAPFKINSKIRGFTGQVFRAQTTYEDLFYLTDQIVLNGEGLKADITIEAFTDLVVRKGKAFLKGRTAFERKIDLYKLALETKKYIEATVAELLFSNTVRNLDLISDLARSNLTHSLTIVTLNHDTLVEQMLDRDGIIYKDGFGDLDADVNWFNNAFDSSLVELLKLHGSINWYRHERGQVAKPAVISNRDSNSWHNARGELITGISNTPRFLTGLTKVFSYNRGIFAELQYRFLQKLHESKLIVMSGYGWGDIPINFQLLNWFERDEGNRLVIMHKDPEQLADGSLELRHVYNLGVNKGQIISIPKWLSETSLEEIEEIIEQR